MKKKSAILVTRISKDLKAEFEETCKQKKVVPSVQVRSMIRQFNHEKGK